MVLRLPHNSLFKVGKGRWSRQQGYTMIVQLMKQLYAKKLLVANK